MTAVFLTLKVVKVLNAAEFDGVVGQSCMELAILLTTEIRSCKGCIVKWKISEQ